MEDLPHAAADMRQVLAAEVQRRGKSCLKKYHLASCHTRTFLLLLEGSRLSSFCSFGFNKTFCTPSTPSPPGGLHGCWLRSAARDVMSRVQCSSLNPDVRVTALGRLETLLFSWLADLSQQLFWSPSASPPTEGIRGMLRTCFPEQKQFCFCKGGGTLVARVLLVGRGRSPASCQGQGGPLVPQADGGSAVPASRSPQGRAIAAQGPEAPEWDKKGYCSSKAADYYFFFPQKTK